MLQVNYSYDIDYPLAQLCWYALEEDYTQDLSFEYNSLGYMPSLSIIAYISQKVDKLA